jgi:HK97 family phage portal protein
MGMIARALSFPRRVLSLENPNVPISEAANWLSDWSGGGTSDSGAPVTQSTSLRLSVVWRCVRVLADGIASLPLFVYERQEPRGRKRAPSHPLSDLLHLTPNPRHSSYQFRNVVQANVVLQGNGYSAIRRDGGGRIRELWPIPASQVTPKVRDDGTLYYSVMLPTGKIETWEAQEMLHLPGLGFDGVKGMSVLSAAREGIGLGLALQRYGATLFKRGGRIPGVIQTNMPKIDAENRKNVAASWEESVGGTENWHKPAIFPKGWEWKDLGIKPNDGQWIESKKFSVLEICRMFGVNPHKVYDYERATFTNFEHSSLSHVVDTVLPWVVCWEQELQRKLLTEEERQRYFIEFSLQGLMRGDTQTRGQFYALGRQWGWFSANDIRDLENLPDLGEKGDLYLVPFNMTPAEQMLEGGSMPAGDQGAGAETPPPAPVGATSRAALSAPPGPASAAAAARSKALRTRRRIRKSQQPHIEDRARMIVKREIGTIGTELKKMLGTDGRNRRDLTALRNTIDEFYATHGAWAASKMQSVLLGYALLLEGAIADELGAEAKDEMSPALERFAMDYIRQFGKREASEGRLQLLAVIADHEEEGDEAVAEALQERLDEWGEKRPGKIGMRESVQFGSAAVKALYVAGGVTVLRWVANPDACPFCSSMDGRTAGVQQNFVSAGEGVDGGEGTDGPLTPSDNIGHPPLHSNCSCDLVAD